MEYDKWRSLQRLMAIEAIKTDLIEMNEDRRAAEEQAIYALDNKSQSALVVESRMGQALLILEDMGIIKVS